MRSRFLLPAALATAFLSVAVAAPARAGGFATFETGNQLFEECQPSASYYKQGVCLGFVAGVADAMDAAQSSWRHETVTGWRACLPANQVTEGQVQDVAVNFLTRHPELRHYGAVGLVAAALAEAFPCPAAA
jgi:hypothetical protein